MFGLIVPPLEFKQCLAKDLVHIGDAAADSRRQDEAIFQYSAALSLNPASPQSIYIKRSKVYMEMGAWEHALDDTKLVCLSFSTRMI